MDRIFDFGAHQVPLSILGQIRRGEIEADLIAGLVAMDRIAHSGRS